MFMNIRVGFSVLFGLLIIALIVCSVTAHRSHKKIGQSVWKLELSLLPPVIGNLIIIVSSNELFSLIGYYCYFLGMDIVIAALVLFTQQYCKGIGNGKKAHKPTFMFVIVILDFVQIVMNIFFGHAFSLERIMVQDAPYYTVVPNIGLTIHRVIDYFIFGCVILIFILAVIKTAKIYREKYITVLAAMIVVAVWQFVYIFSRTPVNRSMIGFGVIGLVVFYLSLYYRPLGLLDRMLSNIASNMNEGLFVYDQYGKCIWANDTGLKLLELGKDDLDDVPEKLTEKFGKREFTNKDWTEKRILGKDKDISYFTIENHFVGEDSRHLAGSYLIIRDNTEEQKKLQREIYNSTHDSLTQLFTKQHFYECIRYFLTESSESDYAVIFVDVKNFKIVNDIFGTAFGDKALIQISDWIRSHVDDDCIYGRLAGDTFGIFMPVEMFRKDKEKIENDLLDFVVSEGNIRHRLLIHLGVYEVIESDIDVSVMFDRAHLALSTIEGNYKEHIAYYDSDLRDKVLIDQRITAGLSEALETDQIRPYLQPITDRTGKVVGAEALARWIHPKQGFMSPAMFIPPLEKNGLIYEVDRHIWASACKILSEWKKKGSDMFISVNISPKDFYYINIVDEINALVKEYDIEPKNLRIEITESVMMNDVDEKFRMLDELRHQGFIVEMDDFGSGFSSLNLLKDMPVDVLKIDMKFLSGSDGSTKASTIIRNIIKLSEDLNIVSLTEGVETGEQYSELSDMGCKLFQGYYFAKPLPMDDFETFAEKHNKEL